MALDLTLCLDEHPGEPTRLGEVAGGLGDAGVDIGLAYLATGTMPVLAAGHLARAEAEPA